MPLARAAPRAPQRGINNRSSTTSTIPQQRMTMATEPCRSAAAKTVPTTGMTHFPAASSAATARIGPAGA